MRKPVVAGGRTWADHGPRRPCRPPATGSGDSGGSPLDSRDLGRAGSLRWGAQDLTLRIVRCGGRGARVFSESRLGDCRGRKGGELIAMATQSRSCRRRPRAETTEPSHSHDTEQGRKEERRRRVRKSATTNPSADGSHSRRHLRPRPRLGQR